MKLKHIALAMLLAPLAMDAVAGVTLTPMANYRFYDSKWGFDPAAGVDTTKLEDHVGWGAALGYKFDSGFGAELDYQRDNTERKTKPGDVKLRDVDTILGSLNGYYAFNKDGVFSPYVLLGGGESDVREKTTGLVATDTVGNVGLGAFVNLTNNIALRAEARGVHNFDKKLWDGLALLGIQFNTGNGKPAPAAAPEPEPQPVVAPPPAAPADSDNDGVPDDKDKCPNTPAGVQVDADGCPLDADKDGVPDYKDKCPNTPAGVQVDTNGCPLDADNDGVPDYLDKCPNTPAGAKVDENGCPVMLKEAINREVKILFDTSKAVIKPEYKSEVEEVSKLAKEYPTAFIEIQGHTDSSGNKKANQKLSQERADAVRNMLVQDFGVDASRVTSVGYGSSQPVADNKTAEGKAKNRRVIAVISGERHKMEMGAPVREHKPAAKHHKAKAAAPAAAPAATPAN